MSIEYSGNNICTFSMTENLTAAIEQMRSNGAISTDSVSAENLFCCYFGDATSKNGKNIQFNISIDYSDIDDDSLLCEKELTHLLHQATENARLDGLLTPSKISANSISISAQSSHIITPIQQPYDDSHLLQAAEEGWTIKNENGVILIKKDPSSERFSDDSKAIGYVYKKALKGSLFHKSVVEGQAIDNPNSHFQQQQLLKG